MMFLGSSVCHQLAERSYFYEGTQMPLCARCIGIHFGFALSAIFLATGTRRYASDLPSLGQLVAMSVIMSLFMVDAGLSYSGLSVSTNLRRSLSGLCLGVVIPFVLFPMLNMFALPNRNPRKLFGNWTTWLWVGGLYLLAAALILLSDENVVLFYAVSIIGVVGVFLFFSTLASVEVMLILDKSRMPSTRKLAIGAAIAVVALTVMAIIHQIVSPSL